MASRNVLPRAFIPLEKVMGLFGQRYVGRGEGGQPVVLHCDEELPLGRRVLYRILHTPHPRAVGLVVTSW